MRTGGNDQYLCYEIRNTVETDSPVYHYFLIGSNADQWYYVTRNVTADFMSKGVPVPSALYIVYLQVVDTGSGVGETGYFDSLYFGNGSVTSSGGGSSGSGGGLGGGFSGVSLGGIIFSLVFVIALVFAVVIIGTYYLSRQERPSEIPLDFREENPLVPMSRQPATCRYCGAVILTAGSRYCWKCGASLLE
jgi:preprotein translocase subunit SecG